MNFFEQQDKARSLSGYLYLLFAAAVVCIIISVFCLASIAFSYENSLASSAWTFELAIISTVITIIVVFLASAVRIGWLSQGGKVVAESMGGKKINQNTKDPMSRQILNVVEEMAIASGTPVPPVYLMEEEGINAFAAGYSPRDAVIGVTRGCATKLNRDQLQGVMAHEFSHILNGDMRINIRLTGIIFGIIFLASIGRILFNMGFYSGAGRRRNDKNNSGGIIIILGLGLLLIGWIGGFFGSIIRASISRQKEFLADASAVQFTRNPDGIAGALKRIGGYKEGSKINSAGAQEFSHMFFCSGISSLFSTHPPLPIRIKRIEPNWNNKYPQTDKISNNFSTEPNSNNISGFTNSIPNNSSNFDYNKGKVSEPSSSSASSFLKTEGQITEEKLAEVRSLISSIPESLMREVKDPFGSRCVIFALLLDQKNMEARERQMKLIHQLAEEGTNLQTEKIQKEIVTLSSEQKLVLIEETRPAITELSENQFSRFQSIILKLIHADESIDLFEWCLHKVIEFDFGKKHYPRQLHGRSSVIKCLEECAIILGALAHYGQEGADPKPAYEAGFRSLDRNCVIPIPTIQNCGLSSIDQALKKLNRMTASAKRSLIDACAKTIDFDGKTTETEIQILRGIASSLSSPLGPNL